MGARSGPNDIKGVRRIQPGITTMALLKFPSAAAWARVVSSYTLLHGHISILSMQRRQARSSQPATAAFLPDRSDPRGLQWPDRRKAGIVETPYRLFADGPTSCNASIVS
jgi:hypothetical protein